ncbi:MAG: aminotransferase class V-fold PLP-dependent enzyme, partial [Candidatus Fimenecus sp.]
QIYNCRKKLAAFFSAPSAENVIFTYNCTASLNMAIKGIARKGGHFIISDLEHNAVLRPLEKLKKDGFCDYSVAKVETDAGLTVKNFQNSIRKNTVAIICTGASNVFGIVPPIKEISALAHKYNLVFIVDCAQSAGVMSVDMKNDGIDILCCAGHKGLYGPSGTGLMILENDVKLNTIIEGGTGSNSASGNQPEVLPDKFESGTPNIPGILGLSAGIDFLNKVGTDNIYEHELSIVRYIQNRFSENPNIVLYTDLNNSKMNFSPILSFNISGMHSEETASVLSENGIAVRAGLHCAPLAHRKLHTEDTGTVRVSPSYFTGKSEIDFFINSVNKIAK